MTAQENVPHRCVLVLGMHRSGTSAFAGTLATLGVDFGCDLMPAAGANPFGYFEHLGAVALNEELLRTAGSAWHRPLTAQGFAQAAAARPEAIAKITATLQEQFGASQLWGLKDPRLCRLLPQWLRILSELQSQPLAVIVVRHPQEVVDSLYRRDGLAREESYFLWLQHLLAVEAVTHAAKVPRVFVTYEALLTDWRATAGRIAQALGFTWPVGLDAAAARIESFLYPKLRHEKAGPPELCPESVLQVYRLIAQLVENGHDPGVHRQLNAFRKTFEPVVNLLPSVLPFAPTPPLTIGTQQNSFEDLALQIFYPRAAGYGEDYSLLHRYRSGLGWQMLLSRLPRHGVDHSRGLRLDPVQCVAVVEIGRIAIVSELDGRTMWSAQSARDFEGFKVSGTALQLSHERHLSIFSYGIDPQIYLPAVDLPDTDEPLRLEIWLRAQTGEEALADLLPAWLATAGSLRTQCAEADVRCAALSAELSQALGELEAAKAAASESQQQVAAALAVREQTQAAHVAAQVLAEAREAELLAVRAELAAAQTSLTTQQEAQQEAARHGETELLAARAAHVQLQAELVSVQSAGQERLAAAESELAAAQVNLARLAAAESELAAARMNLERLAVAETEVAAAQARLERLTAAESELAAARASLAELEGRWQESPFQVARRAALGWRSKLTDLWRALPPGEDLDSRAHSARQTRPSNGAAGADLRQAPKSTKGNGAEANGNGEHHVV